MKIEITGAKEIIKALEGLGPKLEKKVLRSAIRTGLRPLLNAAKANAPVDEGKLRDSLVLRATLKRKRGTISLEVRPDEKKFAGDHYYPAQVEYGTSDTKPNPFMAEAFTSTGPTAKDVALAAILRGINNIVKSG